MTPFQPLIGCGTRSSLSNAKNTRTGNHAFSGFGSGRGGTFTKRSPSRQVSDTAVSDFCAMRKFRTSRPPSSPLAQLPTQAMTFAWYILIEPSPSPMSPSNDHDISRQPLPITVNDFMLFVNEFVPLRKESETVTSTLRPFTLRALNASRVLVHVSLLSVPIAMQPGLDTDLSVRMPWMTNDSGPRDSSVNSAPFPLSGNFVQYLSVFCGAANAATMAVAHANSKNPFILPSPPS